MISSANFLLVTTVSDRSIGLTPAKDDARHLLSVYAWGFVLAKGRAFGGGGVFTGIRGK